MSTSAGVPAIAAPITAPLAGLTTSIVAAASAVTAWPPIQ
jgi:hypothetical protein